MQISKDSPGIFLKETGMYVPPSVVCWPGNRTGPFAQSKFAQLVRTGKLLKEAWVSSECSNDLHTLDTGKAQAVFIH